MKAVIIEKYGSPEVLQWQDAADPVLHDGEVLIRVAATSVNPFDVKQRSGQYKDFAPVAFPGILGLDVAGTIVQVGKGVSGLAPGDQVFAKARTTYAELCAVAARDVVKIPQGLNLIEAAALPTVGLTAYQLVERDAMVKRGETIFVTGALGSVGRAVVFFAQSRGATVIAGVRKAQLNAAKELGVDTVVAVDDPEALAKLPMVDKAADLVGGPTAEAMLGKVMAGGIFATVLRPPANAAQYPLVKVASVQAVSNAAQLLVVGQAVAAGKLKLPIAARFPLAQAAKAHQAVEDHVAGKVLLVA
ncbi:MAG TPA: NADP-dependent oxidoreductase [Opitutales bacterium]|nr:NADP-dependent oxidoreductase [Opitutales bacterium]